MFDIDVEFPKGLLNPELFMGVVSSVSAHTVRVNLSETWSPSGFQYAGGRYGRGEVGEFVLIEGQLRLLLGRVIEVNLPEAERKSIAGSAAGPGRLDAIGSVQLLGSVSMEDLKVTQGVEAYPRLGDRVYAAPHKFVALIPSLSDLVGQKQDSVYLHLGSIDHASGANVYIKPEKLFGRHCAILGSTGGGKSWTIARILEECLKHDSKIILIDATGEYRSIVHPQATHCHLGDAVQTAPFSEKCSVPPHCFIESDFIALFEPPGKVQGPKLRAAIRSLRLAALRPDLTVDGIIKKVQQLKAPIIEALNLPEISPKIDDPNQSFSVERLTLQIEQECVYPDGYQGGNKSSLVWGGENGEFTHCMSLITRINAIRISPAFDCVFGTPSNILTDKINDFIESDQKLLRICVSGISYEYNARQILANSIGRHLLKLARSGHFSNSPIVVVVDEAHNFLGKSIGGEDVVATLDAFELIAREGRKFGLNICLATQRPRDLTEGVLSQIGTLVAHRLTNHHDRVVVERACGEVDRSASAFLPNLKPGEAALIGTDFPVPLTVRITPPSFQPKSDGPDYQSHWTSFVAAVPEEEGQREVHVADFSHELDPPEEYFPVTEEMSNEAFRMFILGQGVEPGIMIRSAREM